MKKKQTGEVNGIYTYDFKDGDYIGITEDGTIVKMETKQTAVEWLEDSFRMNYDKIFIDTDFGLISHFFEKAKAMEKEQIMKAIYDGMCTNFDANLGRAEQYYEETYGK